MHESEATDTATTQRVRALEGQVCALEGHVSALLARVARFEEESAANKVSPSSVLFPGPKPADVARAEVKGNAFAALADVMARSPSSLEVQYWGCRALAAAAGSSSRRGCGLGVTAATAATNALRSLATSEEVQKWGCSALALLASNPASAEHARSRGALRAVLAALRSHPSSADVQQHGCYALEGLARFDTADDEATAADAGAAVDAAEAAMRSLPAHEGVQRCAAGVLAAILCCLDVAVAASVSPDDEGLHERRARSAALRARACGAGAVPLIRTALARFPDGELAKVAHRLLSSLT